MILHPQCAHVGAIAWMAHSKQSNVRLSPPLMISNALSYSLPQTSHFAIVHPFSYLSFRKGINEGMNLLLPLQYRDDPSMWIELIYSRWTGRPYAYN